MNPLFVLPSPTQHGIILAGLRGLLTSLNRPSQQAPNQWEVNCCKALYIKRDFYTPKRRLECTSYINLFVNTSGILYTRCFLCEYLWCILSNIISDNASWLFAGHVVHVSGHVYCILQSPRAEFRMIQHVVWLHCMTCYLCCFLIR